MNKHHPSDLPVSGISPLGGNSVEGTSSGMAEVRDTDTQAVPLVYDYRVGSYISEQAQQELDDRDDDLIREDEFRREEEFRSKIGYRRS